MTDARFLVLWIHRLHVGCLHLKIEFLSYAKVFSGVAPFITIDAPFFYRDCYFPHASYAF